MSDAQTTAGELRTPGSKFHGSFRLQRSTASLTALIFALSLLFGFSAEVPTHGMVASVHPLATQAGVDVLKQGGNAIDAAVAVALTLGVVDGANSGIGGGCFMLIRRANGRLVALDGREMAPGAATRDMFVRNGKGDTKLSQLGPLASGVPGAFAAYEYAVKHFGKKKMADLLLPAAAIAETGFVINNAYASRVASAADELAQFEASKAIFLPHGHPLLPGDTLRQPDLAATYRHLAEQGSRWFYRGPFAQAVENWMKANGGIMTARDFRNYDPRLREPIKTSYRGYTIVGFPPPSSGGVHVAEILNILENFDLGKLDGVTHLHVIAEAMKLAFADRAYWLGDPDFVKVPRGLIDKGYAKSLASKIDLDHVMPVASHGNPPRATRDVFKKHTTHFSVADAEGNWVACTATINTGFGSKVVIPGTGVIMNNEMDDFSIQPGVQNYFGLVGAEANAVAPRKRPLSSMSPTIVLKGNQPIIAVGAAGGPKIISDVVLTLVRMLDLDLPPDQALRRPRIHQQWSPDELFVEEPMPAFIRQGLQHRGHHLASNTGAGVAQVVCRTKDGKGFEGAADPRAGGTAQGF